MVDEKLARHPQYLIAELQVLPHDELPLMT